MSSQNEHSSVECTDNEKSDSKTVTAQNISNPSDAGYDDSEDDNNNSNNLMKTLKNNVDVFIMSEAGKPIYCYSEREDVITLMGVCIALVNYVLKTQNDQLRSIQTRNGLHINFAHRPPLLIVVVCREHSCFDEQTLINQINAQIILTITLKSLKSVFQQAPTYDLKRLIHSNEFRTMDILVESISSPISDMFYSYRDVNQHTLTTTKMKSSIFNNVISFYTSTSTASSAFGGVNSSSTSLLSNASNKAQLNIHNNSNNHNHTNNNDNSMVIIQECKPNVLNRIYVPIAIIPVSVREQITNIVNQAVHNYNDIVVSILFTIVDDERPSKSSSSISSEDEFVDAIDDDISSIETRTKHFNISERSNESKHSNVANGKILKLVTVCNHTNKLKISPLDIQLVHALIRASDHQLSSTESLWLPLCLSRIDPNRFLYGHISYINPNLCLALLDLDHEGFQQCQQVKENIQTRLSAVDIVQPITEIRSNISELGVEQLQYICHQTISHCIMWQASIQVDFSPLNSYLVDRMQKLSLKTCWLRSAKHQCTLLGWHSSTFQLYAQFDYNVSQYIAMNTVENFIKWFKKEEDKFIIKD